MENVRLIKRRVIKETVCKLFFIYVCLFVCLFNVMFSFIWINREEVERLTYTRHSQSMRGEGSQAEPAKVGMGDGREVSSFS